MVCKQRVKWEKILFFPLFFFHFFHSFVLNFAALSAHLIQNCVYFFWFKVATTISLYWFYIQLYANLFETLTREWSFTKICAHLNLNGVRERERKISAKMVQLYFTFKVFPLFCMYSFFSRRTIFLKNYSCESLNASINNENALAESDEMHFDTLLFSHFLLKITHQM